MCEFPKQLQKQPCNIQKKCKNVLKMSNDKKPIREFDGKLLACYKSGVKRISVCLTKKYRLILKEVKNGWEPEFVGNHDNYERWIRTK